MTATQANHDLSVSQQGHYAGAVTRTLAFVVDQATAGFLLAMGVRVVSWIIDALVDGTYDLDLPTWIALGITAVWYFIYYAYPWSVSGKSFGMALLGIRVVAKDGSHAGGRRAVIRTIMLPISFLLLGLGVVMMLFQRERRCLHDLVAGTAVVYDWDARAARLRFLARQQDRAKSIGSVSAG